MKREILKGLTMLTLIVGIAFATAVASANAQSANGVISNIPFEFVVGNETLPAGEYRINTALEPALAIKSADLKHSAMRMTNGTKPSSERRARLVFRRYGQKYFLAEVWNGSERGRQLTKSRQERAIERELASIPSKSEFAASTYETVEVAAVLR